MFPPKDIVIFTVFTSEKLKKIDIRLAFYCCPTPFLQQKSRGKTPCKIQNLKSFWRKTRKQKIFSGSFDSKTCTIKINVHQI